MSEPRGVSCNDCGLDLDEDPELPADQRKPCPDCGSLSRLKRVFAESALGILESLAPTVSIRSYFSSYFLWTALRNAAQAAAIEDAHDPSRSKFDIAHRGHVIASIAASVSFAEAALNEWFQDAADRHTAHAGAYLASLSDETIARMALAWQATRQGFTGGLIEKADLALAAADRVTLDPGSVLCRDVRSLVQVRNALSHYRPEFVSASTPHMHDSLRRRFPPNRLMTGSENAWWPDHCLGAGCAKWAADTARALIDHVADELAIDPNYRRLEAQGLIGDPP
jgi:hypothetical protein